ncbi:hypothetical protein [Actinotalea sp.]|uniref:hypothetical protein n=1 Tax=Actinotalea sp. TaxID=1872145 RepID=UPI002C193C94|nr:hypothetical protein [Actinotalea sp.]HQY33871.1 hypothetical protein [Actinotalea sp.]HRA49677.1 hypothetical protein [Actinotalea sp.]
MSTLTPESMARAVEHARYELLRAGRWEDLREAERFTRVETLISALDASGVTTQLAELQGAAARADELAALVTRRDADVARLTALVSTLSTELTEEIAVRADAETRARSAEGRLAAAREALAEDNDVAELLAPERRAPFSRIPRVAEAG